MKHHRAICSAYDKVYLDFQFVSQQTSSIALTTTASNSSFGSDTVLIFATLHDQHRGYLSFIVYNSNVHCCSIGFGEASPRPCTSTIDFEVTLVPNHLGIVTTFSFNNSDFQDHHSPRCHCLMGHHIRILSFIVLRK